MSYPTYSDLELEIQQLEEENKELKEELEQAIYWKVDYKKAYKQTSLKKDELLEENKKLKEDLANLQAKYDLILKLYNKYGTINRQSNKRARKRA